MTREIVIGLEVHAQLLTTTKLFSGAPTSFGAGPNTRVSAVCLALPGSLPVTNREAVRLAVRAGVALGCRIAARSEWSRKHYFYPDLPKGYQITQYEHPLCEGGAVVFDVDGAEHTVAIRRIHLEEDAGKSIHDGPGRQTRIDLNRAGTPLIEIVTEPDLRSAAEAAECLRAIREILTYAGVNDGNLEEGSLRCDANVSVRRAGDPALGTRCELKNLNSFRFLERAIEVEADRQWELVCSGGTVVQETRLFDPRTGETRSMRGKEDAHDYRYFPEPDLPPLEVSAELVEQIRGGLAALPRARRRRYVAELGLTVKDAQVLTQDRALADLFEACVAAGAEPRRTANWFMSELLRLLNASGKSAAEVHFTPAGFAALMARLEAGTVSGPGARQVLEEMITSAEDPASIIARRGLTVSTDEAAVMAIIDEVMAANPRSVAGYRAGNHKLLGFFVGQVMKALKGTADPRAVSELVARRLSAP